MAKQSPRTHVKYNYKQGNKISHTGITGNPARREEQHQRANPGGHLKQEGRRVSKESALRWERGQTRQGKPTQGYR